MASKALDYVFGEIQGTLLVLKADASQKINQGVGKLANIDFEELSANLLQMKKLRDELQRAFVDMMANGGSSSITPDMVLTTPTTPTLHIQEKLRHEHDLP